MIAQPGATISYELAESARAARFVGETHAWISLLREILYAYRVRILELFLISHNLASASKKSSSESKGLFLCLI